MQIDKTSFVSLKEVAKDIYQRQGLRGFFRGFWVTLNRDCYSFGSYFYVYFQINDYLKTINKFNHFTQFISGGLAGIISWIICYPFDPMKTLIQSNKTEKNISQYEAFKFILNKHGWPGFFTGINSVLLMAFIRHGVIFKTNEMCLSIFHRYL
jgi:solute carrier family 25 carnitine/acylcarnitine transporter 20/29